MRKVAYNSMKDAFLSSVFYPFFFCHSFYAFLKASTAPHLLMDFFILFKRYWSLEVLSENWWKHHTSDSCQYGHYTRHSGIFFILRILKIFECVMLQHLSQGYYTTTFQKDLTSKKSKLKFYKNSHKTYSTLVWVISPIECGLKL